MVAVLIEISVHDRHTSEKLAVHTFKTVSKSNDWINKYPHSHQLRVRTLPDRPSIYARHKMIAGAMLIGLTTIAICYYLLHKY